MSLNIKEFNKKYTIIIDSTSSTLAELVSIKNKDKSQFEIEYIQQVDSSFENYRYEVLEVDSGEPVLEIHSSSDAEAMEIIREEFEIKG